MELLASVYEDEAYRLLLDEAPKPWVHVFGDREKFIELSQRNSVEDSCSIVERHTAPLQSDNLHGSLNVLPSAWYKEVFCRNNGLLLIAVSVSDVDLDVHERMRALMQQASEGLVDDSQLYVVALVMCSSPEIAVAIKVDELTVSGKAIFGARFHGVLTVAGDEASAEQARSVLQQIHGLSLSAYRTRLVQLSTQVDAFTTTREVLLRQVETAYIALVVGELAIAAQYFRRSCNSVLTLFPHHAPLQARLCASLLLHHSLNINKSPTVLTNSASGSDDTNEEQLVSNMLTWLGESYGSSYLPACRELVAFLTQVECGLWLQRLATLTESRTIGEDCLLRALTCFTYCMKVLSRHALSDDGNTTTTLTAPSFVGGEGQEERFVAVLGMRATHTKCRAYLDAVIVQIKANASLTSNKTYLYHEFTQLRHCCKADYTLDTFTLDTHSHALSEPSRHSATMVRALGQMYWLSKDGKHEVSGSCWHYAVHQCVSPGSVARQRRWLRRLVTMTKGGAKSMLTLNYPYGGFVAPLTIVLASLHKPSFLTCATEHVMPVTLHTTSYFPIHVSELQVVFTSSSHDDDEKGVRDGQTVTATSTGECVVDVMHSCEARCHVTFDRVGLYRCSLARAMVRMQGVTCEVTMSFSHDPPSAHDAPYTLPITLRVCPSSGSFNVQCPTSISGVEGDTLAWGVHLTSGHGSLSHGRLTLPCRSYMQQLRVEEHDVTCDQDQYTLNLPDLTAGAAVVLTLQCNFIASGVFRVPMRFSYHSEQHGTVCVTKVMQVMVQLPFSVTFRTYEHTTHSYADSQWHIPLPDTVYTQIQDNKLSEQQHGLGIPANVAHPSTTSLSTTAHDGHAVEVEDMAQYYYVMRNADGATTPSPPPCVLQSEPVLILTQLTCTARCGVHLHRVSVLCVDGVERLYVSEDAIDCDLDEGHEFTIATRLRMNTAGLVVPGFLRVVFSSSAGRRLYADICLPRLRVQPRDDQSIDIRYSYPTTVLLGHAFDLCLHIQSMLDVPFYGEYIVDSTAPSFVLQGRTRTSFAVAARDVQTICVTLTPNKLGKCALPSIMIRDPHHSRIITSSTGVQYVTVLPPL